MVSELSATRAIRVASADVRYLTFDHGDIFPEHFHQPAPEFGRAANQNLSRLSHRRDSLDLDHHEAPPHNRKAGGYVLSKHVNPMKEYVERRLKKERRPVVSFFTSKHEAEQTIHRVLQDNARQIDEWLKTAGSGEQIDIASNISGRGTVVIHQADRVQREAWRAEVRIKNTEHNRMVDHVFTVKLHAQ